MTLLKYSNIEFGLKWWFLYEISRPGLDIDTATAEGLDTLKHTRSVRFLKRFSSEEMLDIEAAVKYGATPVEIRKR